MGFEAGKEYVTRDGCRAKVQFERAVPIQGDGRALVGEVLRNGYWYLGLWYVDGRATMSCDDDLVLPKEYMYAGVYDTGFSGVWLDCISLLFDSTRRLGTLRVEIDPISGNLIAGTLRLFPGVGGTVLDPDS